MGGRNSDSVCRVDGGNNSIRRIKIVKISEEGKSMKVKIFCELCKTGEVVNGQKKIYLFKEKHRHTQNNIEYITGKNTTITNFELGNELKTWRAKV